MAQSRISELPEDILREIFTQSLLHSSHFNPSLALSSVSAWSSTLRHKKAIVLVCKQWNAVGTPYLYREVVLRRYNQLKQLIWTLEHTTIGLDIFDLTVTESSFLYALYDLPTYLRNLWHILDLCPRLSALNLQPYPVLDLPMNLLPPKLSGLKLTKLIIGSHYDTNRLDSNLKLLAPTIKFFSIKAFQSIIYPQIVLIFPSLEELSLTLDIDGPPIDHELSPPRFPDNWILPKIRSLSVRATSAKLYSIDINTAIIEFLKLHGKTLHHLAVNHPGVRQTSSRWQVTAMKHCTHIQHLALDSLSYCETIVNDVLVFPCAKTLDVFSRGKTAASWEELLQSSSRCFPSFPSLETVNFVLQTSHENIFTPPLQSHLDPVEVLKEGCRWMPQHADLQVHTYSKPRRPDYLPTEVVTVQMVQGTFPPSWGEEPYR